MISKKTYIYQYVLKKDKPTLGIVTCLDLSQLII